jgi:hypothetical protein
MHFFIKEVESKSHTWNVNSQTAHSVSSIIYLGQNDDGWVILQLQPRYSNRDSKMAKALQSLCIDMANPDEDSYIQPKSSRMINGEDNISTIVEVEDVAAFLNHLTYCRCITEQDAKLISDAISKLVRQKNANPLATSATTNQDQDSDARSHVELVF